MKRKAEGDNDRIWLRALQQVFNTLNIPEMLHAACDRVIWNAMTPSLTQLTQYPSIILLLPFSFCAHRLAIPYYQCPLKASLYQVTTRFGSWHLDNKQHLLFHFATRKVKTSSSFLQIFSIFIAYDSSFGSFYQYHQFQYLLQRKERELLDMSDNKDGRWFWDLFLVELGW